MNPSMHVRILSDLVRMEMRTLEQYCLQGYGFFDRQIKEFKDDFQKDPASWDEDFAIDMRQELETHLEYNGYFGLLMAFAAFERYLRRLYDLTLHLGTIPELRDVIFEIQQPWLKLENYKKFFNKLGLNIASPSQRWEQLLKLQALRNAIAHQNGSVTSENFDALSKYFKYKKGDWITVSSDEVRDNIRLVTETTHSVGEDFLKALKNKKLLGKKQP